MKITPDMILKLHTYAEHAKIVQEGLEAKIHEIRRQQSEVSSCLQISFELSLPNNTMDLFIDLLEANYDYFDFDEVWIYPHGFIGRGFDNRTDQKDSLRISFEEFNAFVESLPK